MEDCQRVKYEASGFQCPFEKEKWFLRHRGFRGKPPWPDEVDR